MKLGSPAVEDKGKDKFPENIDVLESRRNELPLSAQESSFTVGKSTTRDDNKVRTMRSGLLKEGARVVFGVPKPGKKQKFMEVSKHYVADGNNKDNTTNDSIKFSRYLKPQAPSTRGWKNNSKNDALDVETKSRLNSRKPPVPSFRTLTHKDNNLISSKSTTCDSEMTDRSDGESVENLASHRNKREFGSSSNKRDTAKGLALDTPKKAFTFTSKPRSEHHFNKGKLAPAADGKTPKVELKDKSIPEVNETRRSNRKIQPTSRVSLLFYTNICGAYTLVCKY